MHEALQHAGLDERVAARCQTFAIDVGSRIGLGIGGVIDEREQRRSNRLANTVSEQAATFDDIFAVERTADDSKELRCHVRIEHNSDAL